MLCCFQASIHEALKSMFNLSLLLIRAGCPNERLSNTLHGCLLLTALNRDWSPLSCERKALDIVQKIILAYIIKLKSILISLTSTPSAVRGRHREAQQCTSSCTPRCSVVSSEVSRVAKEGIPHRLLCSDPPRHVTTENARKATTFIPPGTPGRCPTLHAFSMHSGPW